MFVARESGDLGGCRFGGKNAAGDGAEAAMRKRPLKSEKSDEPMVPAKPANAVVTPAELVEGRGKANGKPGEVDASRTQDRIDVYSRLDRVGVRAKKDKEAKFSNLLTLLKAPLLREAYRCLRKDAAPGIDEMTWHEYGEELEARLIDLQDRIQRGAYRAPPVLRVYIPKGDGRMRALGLPVLEDKIVQRAVKMILERIYEPAFLGFSYGCRPGRSQHGALDALAVALSRKVSWVLDADIQAFFDTVDHGWMQKFIEHRIADCRLVWLLMKWLHAGVMEDGKEHEVEEGTPQGGVISPLLANIYLHYVFDLAVQSWRTKHARGETYVVRYVDDVVMCFQFEQDARAMRTALAVRFAEFGLTLHPEKTRVIRFGRFALTDCRRDGRTRPETFDFLGFTHIEAKSRAGKPMLQRRTSKKKRQAKLAKLQVQIRLRSHRPVHEQQKWLNSVLRGHYRYYGVPTNYRAISTFRHAVESTWHRWLQRRSQRGRWTEAKRKAFRLTRPLLPAKICHPWPTERLVLR
jgi:RNA-directed DNA polymerase